MQDPWFACAHSLASLHRRSPLRSQCFFGQARGPQLSNKNPFGLLLRGVLHEHRRFIVLPIPRGKICLRLQYSSPDPFVT